MTIENEMPGSVKTNIKKLFDSNLKKENKRIIKTKIPSIANEFFKSIRAYFGTTFSFQWSLIFEERIIWNILFKHIKIDFKYDVNFNCKNNSTQIMLVAAR